MPQPNGRHDPSLARLSPEEAGRVALQVAELAKAGLPLGSGLRAMAEEYGGGRLGAMLARVAGRIDAGTPLDEAIVAEGDRFPAHVGRLIVAGVRSGRLAEALEELVAIRRKRIELGRRLATALAYPVLLLTGLVVLGAFLGLWVVPQFAAIFDDFGAKLPALTQLAIAMSGPRTWVFVGLAALPAGILVGLYLLRGQSWAAQTLHVVPLVGPIERDGELAALARLLAVLIDHEVPLPAALRMAGDAVAAADLRDGCRAAAAHVEGGRSMAECCTFSGPFPASLRPLVAWGEASSSLADALRAAADVFEGRARVYAGLVESIAPPLVFLLVVSAVGTFLAAMLMPLISLIQNLTG